MRNLFKATVLSTCALLMNLHYAKAQSKKQIRWISFSQLNDSLSIKPKKVFVDFYAAWCTYCIEMDRTTFTNEQVIDILNEKYYAVKMNVESNESIVFGDQIFVNKRKNKVNPVHEIAQLMAGRNDRPFSLPAYVVLDEQFVAQSRYFQFLDSKAMLGILSESGKEFSSSK